MAIIKCKMCGGDLILTEGQTVAECEYCGSRQTVPTIDSEKKLLLFQRAEQQRSAHAFEAAALVYENIIAEYPMEPEAYWGLVLCHYGIEYVDDLATGNKVPTCHRSSFDSILTDRDYLTALEHSDLLARRVLQEEAERLEALRLRILGISAGEKPYDIFICYKETDDMGRRTLDSVLAQDLYDLLTGKQYRVFFSRISLEDKLGAEYEPYIFAALNSARIMLAVGTRPEHFSATWVRNEWSRFLHMMARDPGKHLIPCYKGMDPYAMPAEFARLQAQDLGAVGAQQDLLRGIGKLLPREQPAAPAAPETSPLLRRVELFLEEKNWKDAAAYCERVLDADPENAEAYLMKAMASVSVSRREDLAKCSSKLLTDPSWRNAQRFAQPRLRDFLDATARQIRLREEAERLERQYLKAVQAARQARLPEEHEKAAAALQKLGSYRDAPELAQQSLRAAKTAADALILKKGLRLLENAGEDAAALEKAEKLLLSAGEAPGAAEALQEVRSRLTALEAARRARKLAREAEWDRSWPWHTERAHVETDPNILEQMAAFFDSTEGFRDSAELAALCRDRAQQIARERREHFQAQQERQARMTARVTKHNKRLALTMLLIQLPLWIAATAVLSQMSSSGTGSLADSVASVIFFLLLLLVTGILLMPPALLGLLGLVRSGRKGSNGPCVIATVLSILGILLCGILAVIGTAAEKESAEPAGILLTRFFSVSTVMHVNVLIHMLLRKKAPGMTPHIIRK